MVSEILLSGRENATPAKVLCKVLDLNIRDLTQQIANERRAGEPICASTDGTHPGYFLAVDKGTMIGYIMSLRHRITETAKTLKACLKTLEKLPVKRRENGFSEDELISDPAGCFGQLLDETMRTLDGEEIETFIDNLATVERFLRE